MSLKVLFSRGLLSIVLSFTIISKIIAQENIFPDTIRSCKVDSLMLDAGMGYETYLWSTGAITQFIWVNITGPYWVNAILDTIDITDTVFVSLIDAEIVQNDTSILCADTIMLNGSSDFYDYTWSTTYTMEDTIGIDDSVFIYPRDTSYIYSKIADPALNIHYCIDSVKVSVESIITVDSLEQWQMACPDINKAAVRIEISGGYPPYEYDCTEGIVSVDTTKPYIDIVKLKDGDKILTVTDTIGCLLEYSFEVEAYPLPEINLFSDPSDTVYLQKPYVDFSFENVSYDSLLVDTFDLTSVLWYLEAPMDTNAKSNSPTPSYTYDQTGTYDVVFQYVTFYGCKSTDSIRIVVEPVKLSIPIVMTPNGDDANEYFEIVEDTSTGEENGGGFFKSGNNPDAIDLSKYYISNTLVVFNRWGQKVFEADNYQNDWDGGGLKDGVYFYVLECHGEYEDKTYKGSVMILNGN